jgi:hypothetical protein
MNKHGDMKTKWLSRSWVVPLLGIAAVVGTIAVQTRCVRLERQARSADALQAMIDHLFADQNLSAALKKIHDGDTAGAAQQLEVMLGDDIVRLNAQMEEADERTKVWVAQAFERMAHAHPIAGEVAAGERKPGWMDTQAAAQHILALAEVNGPRAESKRPIK